MHIRQWVLVATILIAPLSLSAQKVDEAAKGRSERQVALIEATKAELQTLKLGENRAGLGVRLASLMWRTDAELARGMFLTAANELIDAQSQAESASRKTPGQQELLSGGSLRNQVLNTIAGNDAEMALALLVKTRPAGIARAISAQPESKKINLSGNYPYLVQNETAMEQRFLKLAADQNPERMITLLKTALAKGLTNETLSLLKKLHDKDPAEAKTSGAQIIDKLTGAKFSFTEPAGSQLAQYGITLVNDAMQRRDRADKSFRFEESQIKGLADKLIAFYLGAQTGYLNHSIIAIAEKYSSANVEKFKEMSKNTRYRGDFFQDPEVQALIKPETSATEVLAAAKKATTQNRHVLFDNAINKLTQQGNLDAVAEVIADNYEGEALDNAMNNVRSQQASRLTNEGRFAEAELIIDQLPENARNQQLLNLANSIYHKDRVENKTYATALIGKVHTSLAERPENSGDMSNYMQVINAYANIESDEAFRMFEQLIPQVNNLADAAAVLNPFQGNGNVRNGEFVVSNGLSYGNFGFDLGVMSRFAQKNFDQTIRLIEMFSRPETRISLRLQIAESLN